jgi:hypothetical protein
MTTRVFAALHVYPTTPHAALNMAIDEALLESATVPSVRFYRWHSLLCRLGIWEISDVADCASGRDVVRRWTGGGIVCAWRRSARFGDSGRRSSLQSIVGIDLREGSPRLMRRCMRLVNARSCRRLTAEAKSIRRSWAALQLFRESGARGCNDWWP